MCVQIRGRYSHKLTALRVPESVVQLWLSILLMNFSFMETQICFG